MSRPAAVLPLSRTGLIHFAAPDRNRGASALRLQRHGNPPPLACPRPPFPAERALVLSVSLGLRLWSSSCPRTLDTFVLFPPSSASMFIGPARPATARCSSFSTPHPSLPRSRRKEAYFARIDNFCIMFRRQRCPCSRIVLDVLGSSPLHLAFKLRVLIDEMTLWRGRLVTITVETALRSMTEDGSCRLQGHCAHRQNPARRPPNPGATRLQSHGLG